MDNSFIFFTDSSCDLPRDYLEQNNIISMELSYTIAGKEYKAYDPAMPVQEFYRLIRSGQMPHTAQVNVQDMIDAFEPYLKEGKDVLYLGFSSALSGTCNSGQIAVKELSQKYPQCKAIVVDSLCASLGQGLLVHLANQLRSEGKSILEVAQWVEQHKLNLMHYFTVDDLMHLHRGGRVSKASAIMGSMLGIKPVLHVDDGGRLVPLSKVRGRKQSLNALVDMAEKNVGNWKNECFFISHGDCLADAEYVSEQVQKRLGIKPGIIDYVGTVIGTHSGPGTVALFLLGEKR